MIRGSRKRRNKNRTLTIPEIPMTPLIDVALTLLVIFMVTTPMMNNIIKVELPSSHSNEMEVKEQPEMIVYIDKSEKIYLNGVVYSLDGLLTELKKIMKKNQDEVVFVKADQAVCYGKVIDLVDTLKMSGGIKYVALATKHAV
ncbi:biopolymer transporter ExbD [Candidatus Dependentiae bacterium]|nr:biopolymer transporter ExbD [Candidatus Dependentiae bacterium]